MSAKVIEVIQVQCARGKGTDQDPVRTVISYYHKDGKLIAEHDPHQGTMPLEYMAKPDLDYAR